MTIASTAVLIIVLLNSACCSHAFSHIVPVLSHPTTSNNTANQKITGKSTLLSLNTNKSTRLDMNFFKKLLTEAFENDTTLPSDKSEDQLEGPNDSTYVFQVSNVEKTNVQKRWLESQNIRKNNQSNRRSSRKIGRGYGSPMNPDLISNTEWELSLFLTGIPNFDPTNSLFGAKTNMSTRRDSSLAKDGFAIGADKLPPIPSVQYKMKLLDDGICEVEESSFTRYQNGQWILSDDGLEIRFSMNVTGFERTVTTKGTIRNVYWSDREEAERKSSAKYAIQPGLLYFRCEIGYGSEPGLLVMAPEEGGLPGGLIQIEQKVGMFGVRSNMVSCGKFLAKMVQQK